MQRVFVVRVRCEGVNREFGALERGTVRRFSCAEVWVPQLVVKNKLCHYISILVVKCHFGDRFENGDSPDMGESGVFQFHERAGCCALIHMYMRGDEEGAPPL